MLQSNPSSTADTCTCKCMPNGIVVTILLNILLWTAVTFSGGALVDCHLVHANVMPSNGGQGDSSWPALPVDVLLGLNYTAPTDRRGFGFFIHEDSNGDCQWEYWDDKHHDNDDHEYTSEDLEEIEDYVEAYLEWMGQDWRRAAKVATSAFFLGFTLAVAATLYFCIAHFKWIRYISGIIGLVLIMPIQFGVFTAMDSDFCKNRDCKVARSGHFAIVAGLLYIVASVLFFFFHNYSGQESSSPEGTAVLVAPAAAMEQQQQQRKAVVDDELTHPDEYMVADYALEDVEWGENQTSVVAVGGGGGDDDGVSDAQEIKPAQIY